MRPFLVFVSTTGASLVPRLFDPAREFDIAINDYSGVDSGAWAEADFRFSVQGLKYRILAGTIPTILSWGHAAVALLDDDLDLDAPRINRLFRIGQSLELDLWQPAHAHDSHNVWPVLWRVEGSFVRRADFVEIMCPFFSRAALRTVAHSFALSESGWGLDFLWPQLLKNGRLAIVDSEPMIHTRPSASGDKPNSHGLTARQEWERVKEHLLSLP